ncbi:MAG: efflux RND transporter periplasmic adaptor subunit [Pyrinomonadaceae bacterium MAG19_C2-C3]|nr:efflux RND transporter periplasmic adaptor subunit [Pyrinomonadaceae bacterium MAG19_C2-C3]
MALSRKRKIIIGSAVAVVLLAIVAVSIFASRRDEPEVTVVKLQTRPELRSVVSASGEVRPVRFINLTSEVNGRIEEIYVSAGDKVQQGQPLVRLDPTQLQSSQDAQLAGVQSALTNVQSARAQVTAAENQVAQAQQSQTVAEAALSSARQGVITSQTNVDRAQVDVNTAQRELNRITQLVEAGAASRSEFDNAQDQNATARVALRTAQAQLEQQRIAVQEATARVNQQRVAVQDARTGVQRANIGVRTSETQVAQQQAVLRGSSSQLSKANQVSPLTGVVADIPARVGQFALANLSSTSLMTIADMSAINVEVNVDETEIKDVEVGQNAKIKVDALGERELEGVVIQKNPLAVGKSDTGATSGITDRVNVQEAKEFKVVIEIRNMSDEIRDSLRPRMNATAEITTKIKNNVIAVPLEAVVPKPSATGSGSSNTNAPAPTPTPVGEKEVRGVFILENGKAKFVEVETGITGETDIEITNGLQADMTVIRGPTRILRTLKEGAPVKPQTRASSAANSNANSNS